MKAEYRETSIIDQAHSALRDLYGLVPAADRNDADDHLRALQRVIHAYNDALNRFRQVEVAIYHGRQEIERAVRDIEEIGQ